MSNTITLEELYALVSSNNKSFHFSRELGKTLKVSVNGKLDFTKKKSEKDTEGLMPVTLQACHIGKNINNTNVPERAAKAALSSFSNRPILGMIHYVDDQPEFYGHNRHEEDGETVYDEIPVGVIPESCKARLEYDEEKDKTYVVVSGYIYEEYSKAAEILRREGQCDVSVELQIRDISYSVDDKCLVINDFYFDGVTILGKDENGNKVYPGMQGSNITISDYSASNDVDELNEKLDRIINALNINEISGKEEDTHMSLFEKLLEKYGVTAEDVDFEYEGLSDEELETAFSEKFTNDTNEDEGEIDTASKTEEFEETTEEDGGETEEEESKNEYSYSITHGEKTLEFSATLSEQLEAISILVNDTYGETDGTWYSVDADSDKKVVYMFDMWGGRAYRQSYKVKGDTYSLTGDRVEVYSVWMTADEKKQFESMTSNYSAMSEELQKYHEEPQKAEILASDAYASVSESEEFAELQKNHFDLSIEEVTAKADSILLEAAKNGTMNFSAEPKKPTMASTALPRVSNASAKRKRYGGMFK